MNPVVKVRRAVRDRFPLADADGEIAAPCLARKAVAMFPLADADGEIAAVAIVVTDEHMTRGVQISAKGTAEGFVAAADALLYEAFRTLPLERAAPDGTPLHELHDRARDALRGMLAGLAR